MNTLVTGGAGFLGSHLIDFLLGMGHTVWCVDNLVTGSMSNLQRNPNLVFLNGDLSYLDVLDMSMIDWIFHLASPTAPGAIMANRSLTLHTNIEGTRDLLEYANLHGSKMLFVSSVKVHGECGRVAEYITGKRAGEALCEVCDAKIARLANTYGPRMALNDSRVIPSFIKNALECKPLSLWNGGMQTDTFCYVSDIVRGLISFMASDLTGVVEFGHTETMRIRDLANLVLLLTGSRSSVITSESVQVSYECHQRADISRARELLGWEPSVHPAEGLKETINYFKERFYVAEGN